MNSFKNYVGTDSGTPANEFAVAESKATSKPAIVWVRLSLPALKLATHQKSYASPTTPVQLHRGILSERSFGS